MNRSMVRAAAVISMVLLTACEDSPTGSTRVDRVEVGPEDQVLVVGDSTTVTAVPLTTGGDIVVGPVLWRSLSPGVATLQVSGGTAVVKANAPGTARIEAESGGRTGFTYITVIAAPIVETVTLLPTTMVIEAGEQASIQAVARDADGEVIEGRAVTWAVVGTAVTVAPDDTPGWATVAAQANGEAVIRATIDGVAGEAEIQVVTATPPPASVSTVEITPSNFSLPVNHETPLQAIAKDANGAVINGLPVTWTSTAAAVATIEPIGVSAFASLSGKSAGTTVIRATIGGVTAQITVEVTAAPPPADEILYLFLTPGHRGIWTDQVLDFTQHLSGLGRNGTISNPAVTWSIADSSIASIDANGKVRGLRKGTTTVRATAGSVYAIAYVTVFEPATGPVVFDLTYDWWDGGWHMPPSAGTEQWTDPNGTVHTVDLWITGGSLTMTTGGTYERVLVLQGWAHYDGAARLAIEREIVDEGTYGIMVGGETGYWMHSTTTPGYVYEIVSAYNAGHVVMRAEVGTAPKLNYLFRMRQ